MKKSLQSFVKNEDNAEFFNFVFNLFNLKL